LKKYVEIKSCMLKLNFILFFSTGWSSGGSGGFGGGSSYGSGGLGGGSSGWSKPISSGNI
jgi:hypothetical protein